MNEIVILLPEIFLSITVCILLMLGLFTRSANLHFVKSIFFLTFVMAIYIIITKIPDTETFIFSNLFKLDPTVKALKLLILVASCFFILLLKQTDTPQKKAIELYEFPVICALSVIGMLCMLSANNFLSLYVSIELQSLCLYVLAAYEKDNSNSSEAGLKYFVLGSFASGLLLFGISLIYGFTGNLDFNSLQNLLASNSSSNIAIGVIIGIVMVLIGLFFKVSAAPFHMWTPDVYQGSPTIVTTLFASIAKVAAVGVVLNLCTNIFSSWAQDLQPILEIITAASVLVGAIGALKQSNIKRLLAYSSIGHIGYILLAISSFNSIDATHSVLLYLSIYLTMTMATFALIMNLYKNKQPITELDDLSGLANAHPLIALSLGILMFSLAGIPPLAGFFAKFFVFSTAMAAGIYYVSIISVIAAVIAAYYYLKIVKIMYLDELKNNLEFTADIITKAIIGIMVLFNLFYILL